MLVNSTLIHTSELLPVFNLAWYISVDLSYVPMQKYSQTGISFPNEVLWRIDAERGDVSRSRYILRQLEKVLQTSESSTTN
jgi:hypothetical protein